MPSPGPSDPRGRGGKVQALLEQERSGQAPARRHFSPDESHGLARKFYRIQLDADEAERQQGVEDIAGFSAVASPKPFGTNSG